MAQICTKCVYLLAQNYDKQIAKAVRILKDLAL